MAKAKINDNTDDVLRELDKKIQKALKTSALLVERTAKQIVVVRTGTLKRSIISDWYGSGKVRQVSSSEKTTNVKGKSISVQAGESVADVQTKQTAVVGTNVEYAPYVELGTSKTSAKPFLRPALHSNMTKIRRIFGGS
ncbi:HK97 gp10 family phage protein [Candidatus Pacearchaeota archaeon]|nr:HK97 gp10 family phage protein [Candidatus Pacearchaeota archaeon]